MDALQTAWLAGLIEGEGCFTFSRTPICRVQMTDEDIVARIAALFGSAYQSAPPRGTQRKTVFSTSIHGARALALMESIRPFMGKRRTERMGQVIALAASRPGVARGERAGAAKLTDAQVRELLQRYRSTEKPSQREIGRHYGVSCRAVNYIVRGLSYRHLQADRLDHHETVMP